MPGENETPAETAAATDAPVQEPTVEAQSPVVRQILGERDSKIERINELLQQLTSSQLDSVHQYATTQLERIHR